MVKEDWNMDKNIWIKQQFDDLIALTERHVLWTTLCHNKV